MDLPAVLSGAGPAVPGQQHAVRAIPASRRATADGGHGWPGCRAPETFDERRAGRAWRRARDVHVAVAQQMAVSARGNVERRTGATSTSRRGRRNVDVDARAHVAASNAALGANGERHQVRASEPPGGGTTRGGGFECERVSRCGKNIEKSVRDVLGPGGHLGLRAAQDCRMRVGSATALRPKMPSPLTNARSLSPETVRRGGERDRCGHRCYVVQTR